MPESNHQAHNHDESNNNTENQNYARAIDLSKVVAIARDKDVMPAYSIVFPRTETGV